MRVISKSVVVMLIITLLVCASCATSGVSKCSLEEFMGSIDVVSREAMQQHGIPGAAVAVIEGGEPVSIRTFGVANRANKTAVSSATLFNSGSISKTFTAWAVVHLVEQGKLELDTPVSRYLSKWKFGDSPFDESNVTIRKLLNHTSGIQARELSMEAIRKIRPSVAPLLDGAIIGTTSVALGVEPGTQFIYSLDGYAILQLLIEEASGESFDDYLASRVLAPLGMDKSTYDVVNEAKPGLALAYGGEGQEVDLALEIEAFKGAAGLYVSIEDLAKFIVGNIDVANGRSETARIISASHLDEMTQVEPLSEGEKERYGLGYSLKFDGAGNKLIGHTGRTKAWASNYTIDLENSAGIAVLTNSTYGYELHETLFSHWLGRRKNINLKKNCD